MDMVDTNKDGEISKKEFKELLKEEYGKEKRRLEKELEELDEEKEEMWDQFNEFSGDKGYVTADDLHANIDKIM